MIEQHQEDAVWKLILLLAKKNIEERKAQGDSRRNTMAAEGYRRQSLVDIEEYCTKLIRGYTKCDRNASRKVLCSLLAKGWIGAKRTYVFTPVQLREGGQSVMQ